MRLSADLFLSYVRSRIEKTGRREQFSLSAWPPTHIESDRQTGCEGATAEGKRGKQRGSREGKGRKENAAVFPSSSHFASKFYFSSRHSPTGLSLSLFLAVLLFHASCFIFAKEIRVGTRGRSARRREELRQQQRDNTQSCPATSRSLLLLRSSLDKRSSRRSKAQIKFDLMPTLSRNKTAAAAAEASEGITPAS